VQAGNRAEGSGAQRTVDWNCGGTPGRTRCWDEKLADDKPWKPAAEELDGFVVERESLAGTGQAAGAGQ